MADSLDSTKTQTPIPHWHTPDGEVLEFVRGSGARVYDETDREYLDFVSQLFCVNAGHDNQAIIDAMQDQVERIPYVGSNRGNDVRRRLAGRIAEKAPDPLSDVYFSVSGSEANEAAVQFAREYQDAPKVLTRWRSYHGWTYGAGSLSGDATTRKSEAHATTTGSVKFLPPLGNDEVFDADTPEGLAEQAANHLEFVIRNERPDTIAALLTEPIAGASGAYTPPADYFERVRDICDKYDILLIADEVITGFGRCGDWFGMQTEDVPVDMLTFAKGVTSSYSALAGVLVSDELSTHIQNEGLSVGQTFAGHPVSCAAGLAAVDEYEDRLIDNVRSLAPVLEDALRDVAANHDVVAEVRGRGFLWGLPIADPETGEPFVDPRVEDTHNPVKDVVQEAQDRGVLVAYGRPPTQLLVAPPFCIDEHDIEEAATALDDALTAVFD